MVEIEHGRREILVVDRVAVEYLPALLFEFCRIMIRNLTDLHGEFHAMTGKREFEHGQHGAAFSAADIQNGILNVDVEIFRVEQDICSTMDRTPLHIWGPTRLLPDTRSRRNRLPEQCFLDEQGRLAQDALRSELLGE